jgi:hypothetical protein
MTFVLPDLRSFPFVLGPIFVLLGAGLLVGCAGPRATSTSRAKEAGAQIAVSLDETDAPFGYHQYLPPTYDTDRSRAFPLLVFLHGSGERGDGASLLSQVLRHDPPRAIRAGEWPSDRPFIVLSPQLDTTQGRLAGGQGRRVHRPRRGHLPGRSVPHLPDGIESRGAWHVDLRGHSSRATRSHCAGCGDGTLIKEQGNSYCALSSLPLWAFHGGDDPVVDPRRSTVPIRRVNQCTPPPDPEARLTLFPGVGHDSWSLVYDGSGHEASQKGTPFNRSLCDWLLQFERQGPQTT